MNANDERARLDEAARTIGANLATRLENNEWRKRQGQSSETPNDMAAWTVATHRQVLQDCIRAYDPWYAFEQAVYDGTHTDVHKDECTPMYQLIQTVLTTIFDKLGTPLVEPTN